MKLFLVTFLIYLSVVESGVILDTFQSGLSSTRRGIKCGINAIGGLFTHNRDRNCGDTENEVDVETKTNKPVVDENRATSVEIIKAVEGSSTERSAVTVPEGKRLINVGANCPEGQRGDGKGNCREEY